MNNQFLCTFPDRNRRDGILVAILLFVSLLFQGPLLMGGVPLDEDTLLFYYPLHAQHPDGNVGLWNPYQFCGMPRDANPQSQLLYFPNLLFLVFPITVSFALLLIGHYALGGFLMYWLLRGLRLRRPVAFWGALVFLVSTYWRCKIVNLGLLEGIAWVPGVLFFFLYGLEQRRMLPHIIASIFFAMVIMSGMPHPAIFTAIFLGCIALSYAIWGSGMFLGSLLSLAVVVGGAALLSAGVLIPAWLYSPETARTALPLQEALVGALRWPEMWKVFLGGLTQTDIARFEPWEGTCVIGVTALLFIPWSRSTLLPRIRNGLLAALVFAVLCTLGEQGGLYPLLHHYLPGWDFINLPNRSLMLAAFVLPILSAVGLQSMVYRKVYPLRVRMAVAAVGGVSLVVFVVLCIRNIWNLKTMIFSALTGEVIQGSVSSTEWAIAFVSLWLGLTCLFLGCRCWLLITPRMAIVVLSVFVVIQSAQFTQRLFLDTTNFSFFDKPTTLRAIQDQLEYAPFQRFFSYEPTIDFGGDVRIAGISEALMPRLSEVFSVCEVQGYDPMVSRRYAELLRAWSGTFHDTDERRRVRSLTVSKPMLDFLGVRWVIGNVHYKHLYKGTYKGPAEGRFQIPSFEPREISGVTFRWMLRDAPQLIQGRSIGEVVVYDGDQRVQAFPIRVGIEIANAVTEFPELQAAHQPATIFRSLPLPQWGGYGRLFQYSADFVLDQPAQADRIELELNAPVGNLGVYEVNIHSTDFHGLQRLKSESKLPVFLNPGGAKPVYFSRVMKEYEKLEEMVVYLDRLEPGEEMPVFVSKGSRLHLGSPPITRNDREEHRVTYSRDHSDRFQISTHSLYDGILAVQENYSPYWRARVDGKAVEVFRVNHAFMGLHISAGEHEIQFAYKPYPFYIGCSIGGSVLVVFVLVLFLYDPRKFF
jgi:hypothetical protein